MAPLIARWFGQAHRRMYLAAFLLDFSVAIGLTAMPFFIFDRINGGVALSGTVGAVQMAVYAIGCFLSAGFVSRTGNCLRLALLGVGVFALLFASVPFAGTPVACAVTASVPFLGLALAWPAMQAWLGQEPDPAARARHLAGFNTATAFGFTFSPLLAGPLYDADFRLPFVALVALCLVVLGLIASLSLRTALPRAAHGEQDDSEDDGTKRMTSGLLYASWMATFTANGLFAAVRSVYPMRVQELATQGNLTLAGEFRPALLDAAGPATTYSWLAFLLSLATVVCFAILGRTQAWRGRLSLLIAGQLAAAASFVLLSHARSLAVMVLCFAVVGANYGVCFFASLYYSLADARTRHRRAAINEGVLGAGGFAGGIGLGYAAESAGITAAFQWAPLFVLLAIAVQGVLLNASRPASEESRDTATR
ncbi:MAG: MFS transporter [Candidatus Hydrogenedentes bacterium]|nr:MFS transporter [Candidatus Hydrogenedentota bacterium]